MARGTIRQRSKSGNSWTIQVYLGMHPGTGSRQYRIETVRGAQSDAERRLTEILYEIDHGNRTGSGRLTVAGYLESWLEDHAAASVKPRTLQGYRDHVRRYIIPSIGRIRLDRLTPWDVERMKSNLLRRESRAGRPLSPRTVLQAHRVLSSALTAAVRLGLVSRNVVSSVEPPRAQRYEASTLDWPGVHRFLSRAPDLMYLTLFLLAVHTGLRRSELVGLQWPDANLDSGALSVRRALVKLSSGDPDVTSPKSDRSRVVNLTDESVAALREYRESWPGRSDFIFCRPDGRLVDPDLVTKVFRRTADRAGFPRLRFHDLRHTHATLMLSESVHPKVVHERLGHSSINVTLDLYSHVMPTVQQDAVRRFGEASRTSLSLGAGDDTAD
jgi:integrase